MQLAEIKLVGHSSGLHTHHVLQPIGAHVQPFEPSHLAQRVPVRDVPVLRRVVDGGPVVEPTLGIAFHALHAAQTRPRVGGGAVKDGVRALPVRILPGRRVQPPQVQGQHPLPTARPLTQGNILRGEEVHGGPRRGAAQFAPIPGGTNLLHAAPAGILGEIRVLVVQEKFRSRRGALLFSSLVGVHVLLSVEGLEPGHRVATAQGIPSRGVAAMGDQSVLQGQVRFGPGRSSAHGQHIVEGHPGLHIRSVPGDEVVLVRAMATGGLPGEIRVAILVDLHLAEGAQIELAVDEHALDARHFQVAQGEKSVGRAADRPHRGGDHRGLRLQPSPVGHAQAGGGAGGGGGKDEGNHKRALGGFRLTLAQQDFLRAGGEMAHGQANGQRGRPGQRDEGGVVAHGGFLLFWMCHPEAPVLRW